MTPTSEETAALWTPVEQMTDAQIVSAVRSGRFALVPIDDDAHPIIGEITLDDREDMAGHRGLMVRLSKDACRFVAPQLFSADTA